MARIPARFKLLLTGTPIQNRLQDLMTLFQFLKIDTALIQVTDARLFQGMIRAFILRRKKQDVLKELPEKNYLTHAVIFSEAEQQLYNQVLQPARTKILTSTEDSGENGSSKTFGLFEQLLRARQVCDSALLLPPDQFIAPAERSSKLDRLLELVTELMDNGHSVLIYSQWTQFLDLIENEFQKESGDCFQRQYSRLDGSTKDRAGAIEKFTDSATPCAFLLSLHAGGVGLNLTQADHVIFCDPWWNPYVELQAEDRVHRIGQRNSVFIHRLCVQGSIEEGIQKLQLQKRSLESHLVETKPTTLTMEDIKSLVGSQ
jgi:SNF2 family DNA or RNA helicase